MIERLKQLCDQLVYISETDSEVEPFCCAKPKDSTHSFESFMNNQIRMDERWQPLKDFMTENLTDLRLIKTGEVEVRIYGIGKKGNKYYGFKAFGVET